MKTEVSELMNTLPLDVIKITVTFLNKMLLHLDYEHLTRSLLAWAHHLLITFANDLNPDQNVPPDLDPKGLAI